MKKFILTFTAIIATMITVAQSQFYVIMKDGSGASYPEDIVDSLTFDNNNGAKIYGFEDLIKRLNALESKVAFLENKIGNIDEGEKQDSSFGHAYVDLGLPSGTLWATCNVGSITPDDYGLYFAWGETEPQKVYTTSNYEYDLPTLASKGIIDKWNNLTKEHDAASVFWGGDWCTPNKNEIQELFNYCTHVWTDVNGVNGILFTGPSNNSVFFPVAGMKKDEDAQVGVRGYYMVATASINETNCNYLYLSQDNVNLGESRKSHGRTIRPILRKNAGAPIDVYEGRKINGHEYVDLGLPSGLLWATQNIGSESPEDTGDFITWGCTSKSDTHYGGLEEEELLEKGIIDKNGNLTPDHDAAHILWKDIWRMPTKDDFQELIDNCQFYESQLNGYRVIAITGPNGSRIVFPIFGNPEEVYHPVNYWSSTFYEYKISELTTWAGFSNAFYCKTYEKIGEEIEKETSLSIIQVERYQSFPIRPVANPFHK